MNDSQLFMAGDQQLVADHVARMLRNFSHDRTTRVGPKPSDGSRANVVYGRQFGRLRNLVLYFHPESKKFFIRPSLDTICPTASAHIDDVSETVWTRSLIIPNMVLVVSVLQKPERDAAGKLVGFPLIVIEVQSSNSEAPANLLDPEDMGHATLTGDHEDLLYLYELLQPHIPVHSASQWMLNQQTEAEGGALVEHPAKMEEWVLGPLSSKQQPTKE